MGAAKQSDFSVRLDVDQQEAYLLTPTQGDSGRSRSFGDLAGPPTREARNYSDAHGEKR